MPQKHAFFSTTVQGVLVMLLSALLPMVTELTTLEAQSHAQDLVQAVSATLAIVGAIWAARGRKGATDNIYFVKKDETPATAPAVRQVPPTIPT